jgi:hypothetical protein
MRGMDISIQLARQEGRMRKGSSPYTMQGNQPTLDHLLKIRDDHLDMALATTVSAGLGLIQTVPC